MNVYIAAAYGRRDEMVELARTLEGFGHRVTSRWVFGAHEVPPAGIEPDSPEHSAWAAKEDLEHLLGSDCCVSVTGGGTRSRGGRHVEFGVAFMGGQRLIVLGDRENVFHFLPRVEHYANVAQVVYALGSGREAAVADTRNKCGFKGVRFDPAHNRWRAQIEVAGREIPLGDFRSAEGAARACDDAAHEHFGEFAWRNFPEKGAPS